MSAPTNREEVYRHVPGLQDRPGDESVGEGMRDALRYVPVIRQISARCSVLRLEIHAPTRGLRREAAACCRAFSN